MSTPRLSLALFAPIACALVALLTIAHDVRCETSIETPVSGSRLVPLFLMAEDGSREFAGWFDRLQRPIAWRSSLLQLT